MTDSPSLTVAGRDTLDALLVIANSETTETDRIIALLTFAERSERIAGMLLWRPSPNAMTAKGYEEGDRGIAAARRDYLTIASILRLEASALPMIAA